MFAWLGNVRPQGAIKDRGWISNVVQNLLSGSTSRLIELEVSHEDAISLVGRALFTRFMVDRSLLPEDLSEPATGGAPFPEANRLLRRNGCMAARIRDRV